jgi:hypothetical protein
MAMMMILSDLQMPKSSQTADNFAMAPLTYTKYCPVIIKYEKIYKKQTPYNQGT